MSIKRCYYECLEVQKGASGDVLKSAYRKMAMRFHPDKNPGDHTAELKFKEINEAYDVLKDDQKRAAYDRFGHAAFEGGMGAAGARAGGHPFGDFASSFGDVFEDIFGQMMGGGRSKRQNRGQDLRYNLDITLEEAFTGRAAEIKVPTAVACDACSGSGAEPGHSAETCPTCAGHGKVRATQGFFTIERTCSSCRGAGKVIRHPCKTCRGAGLVEKERTLNVDVPPGVEEGTRIRLSGEGAAGRTRRAWASTSTRCARRTLPGPPPQQSPNQTRSTASPASSLAAVSTDAVIAQSWSPSASARTWTTVVPSYRKKDGPRASGPVSTASCASR